MFLLAVGKRLNLLLKILDRCESLKKHLLPQVAFVLLLLFGDFLLKIFKGFLVGIHNGRYLGLFGLFH
jgi:hypothetical protein